MAMNVGSSGGGGDPEVMMDINTTPLIDVMLVLIIMLIITIPIQLHSVNLNMPVGHAAAADRGAGGGHHRHRLRRHRALERRGACPTAPRSRRACRSAAAQADQPEVHLRPEQARRVQVASPTVLASAQRLGVTKLGMIGNEQFVK